MSTEDIEALIVRNILDVERAYDILWNDITPKVGKEIDNIIENWAHENDWWYSEEEFDEHVPAIAPNAWRSSNSDDGEDKFVASFYADSNDVGNDDPSWSWLTQLCGQGSAPYGFRWVCDFVELGTKKKEWKAFLSKNNATAALKGLGFEYQDKSGTFFLPFIIDKEALAVAIKDNNIEDALEPVRAALKIIIESWVVFDGFIREFKKQQ
jgi:hypothetical protein